jgi:cytosine/adenosine deaminase-related metal-dependent hydrolase
MEPGLSFVNGRVALSADETVPTNVLVSRGRISRLDARAVTHETIDVSGHLLLPALVNAHDHLEFNLFPRLGRGPYRSAAEWARDIYRPNSSPIREHISVPKLLRYQWGALKNLISGVGTVAHHNPYDRKFAARFPIRVLRRYGWAHSLAFSADLAEKYRATPQSWPFIVHAAEGCDAASSDEIDQLDKLGVLSSRTVLVHGVGIGPEGIRLLKQQKVALVLCPTSNLFTLGAAPSKDVVFSGLPVGIGSDSALTAEGDLLDECRTARKLWNLSPSELYRCVTCTSAKILRIDNGASVIRPGGIADLLLLKDDGLSPADSLMNPKIEALFVGGRLRIATPHFLDRNSHLKAKCPHFVEIQGRGAYYTCLPVRRMLHATARFIGSEVYLAGRRVRV